MEQQLAQWFSFNSTNSNMPLSTVQNKKIDSVMGLLGDKVLSLAELVGSNKSQLLQTDSEITNLYKKYGDKNSDFIDKLKVAPVTGMATILCACQNRAGFLPDKEEYSLGKFNQFITNLTKCPLISVNDSKSFNSSGTFTDKKKVMPDSIIENFLFKDNSQSDKILIDQIHKSLVKEGNKSYKLDIYNMEILGDTDAYMNIKAGTIEITCTSEILKHKFTAEAKGFNVELVMSGVNWSNSVTQTINAIPFASISQWIEISNLI